MNAGNRGISGEQLTPVLPYSYLKLQNRMQQNKSKEQIQITGDLNVKGSSESTNLNIDFSKYRTKT